MFRVQIRCYSKTFFILAAVITQIFMYSFISISFFFKVTMVAGPPAIRLCRVLVRSFPSA